VTLEQAIEALTPHLGDAVVVHANGYISRRSYAVEDRPGNFYMIGSMGLASSIGLGVALARPDRRVVIYDGDGNLLMNLGSAAMIAHARPANLCHVVFDNGAYASTGNQPAISRDVPLERVAAAAGFRSAVRADTPEALADAFRRAQAEGGPSFILAAIELESGPFQAGRVALTPEEIRDRFSAAIRGGA
jgi:thiamine pyrophosphate-dependent acetolactate synthase large subunit-like protein